VLTLLAPCHRVATVSQVGVQTEPPMTKTLQHNTHRRKTVDGKSSQKPHDFDKSPPAQQIAKAVFQCVFLLIVFAWKDVIHG